MPFSANSSEGPVTLIGVNPQSVELMRSRNRKEGLYFAKCCGAPLSIRVAEGKAPHFVHKTASPNCDSAKGETPEHRRLKHLIAETATKTYEWEVETEARHADESGKALWQADVLVWGQRNHKIAFEVQLSNPDYEHMLERQVRYSESSVRGLWFVRTKKGFPPGKNLPVFTIEKVGMDDMVTLGTRWDPPKIWAHTKEANWIELPEFVEAALDKRLQWAPYLNRPDTTVNVFVDCEMDGHCRSCARKLYRPFCCWLLIASDEHYPAYRWSSATDKHYRTKWKTEITDAVWNKFSNAEFVLLQSPNSGRCRCGHGPHYSDRGPKPTVRLTVQIQLDELPKPRIDTMEWAWLNRWAVFRV
nr:competence protein CoiA family protein [uncultured Rhodoferax sp.]